MARGGVRELLRVGVEREAERRRHLVGVQVAEHAPQDLRRRVVLVGERAERVAQLPHQHGGVDAMARDVADGDVHEPVGATDGVEPVATDDEAGLGGVVAPEQLDSVDRGQAVREEAALQQQGEIVLALERGRAIERLRGLLGVPPDLRPLRRVEGAGVGEEQAERAEARPRARHERRRVQGVRCPEQRVMDAGKCRAQVRVLADDDLGAGVVGEFRRLLDDHVAREGGRREGAVRARRELELVVVLALEGDEAERVRERLCEARDEAVRDLATERCVAIARRSSRR